MHIIFRLAFQGRLEPWTKFKPYSINSNTLFGDIVAEKREKKCQEPSHPKTKATRECLHPKEGGWRSFSRAEQIKMHTIRHRKKWAVGLKSLQNRRGKGKYSAEKQKHEMAISTLWQPRYTPPCPSVALPFLRSLSRKWKSLRHRRHQRKRNFATIVYRFRWRTTIQEVHYFYDHKGHKPSAFGGWNWKTFRLRYMVITILWINIINFMCGLGAHTWHKNAIHLLFHESNLSDRKSLRLLARKEGDGCSFCTLFPIH